MMNPIEQSEELVLAEHIDLERSSFDGNPRLRPAGIPVRLTESQMEEYVKCAEDPLYFIEKYIKIISLDEGLVPFKMYGYQKKMVKQFRKGRFTLVKAPRQCGKSTTVSGFVIWCLIFLPSYAIGIMANKMENAQGILDRVRLAYENVPKWLQQGVITWNKRSIELENHSSVFAAPTTEAGLRSKSLNLAILDEFAHVKYNLQQKFFTSTYPVITSGTSTKIIIISTPNGMELFFNLWKGAIAGKNGYVPIEVHWSETPGRDEEWKRKTIENTSAQQFRQEFECVGLDTSIILREKKKIYRLTMAQLFELMDKNTCSGVNYLDYKYIPNDLSMKELMQNVNGVVYKLTREDGLEYIGITIDFTKRLYEHVKMSERFRHIPIKSHEILFSGPYSKCMELEPKFIQKYDTFFNGLNGSIDGKGNHLCPNFTTLGFKFTEESRNKMSISAVKRIERQGGFLTNEEQKRKSIENSRIAHALLRGKPGNCYKTSRELIEKIIKEYDEMVLKPEQLAAYVKVSLKQKVMSGDSKILISPNGKKMPLWKIKVYELCKKYPITEKNLEHILKGQHLTYKEFKRV